MSAWEEAIYTINSILDGVKINQITGIPPKNMESFSVSPRDKTVRISAGVPSDTVIEGQLVCTCAGVRIVRKVSKAPLGPDDGTLIADLKAGNVLSLDDIDLVNGVTYYYGFYPYSDHGVYNYNSFNIKSATPDEITDRVFGFDQNFEDKNPETTITYSEEVENYGYSRMICNEDLSGYGEESDWTFFLDKVLKNKPAMVNKNGVLDYWLDPRDYTKKEDGTASDYNNLNYDGGAFAWINKLYTHVEDHTPVNPWANHASTGRSVRFSFKKWGDDWYPMAFCNRDKEEMDGLWLPMGYGDKTGKILIADTYTCVPVTTGAMNNLIISEWGDRAAWFGGALPRLIRDLIIMLFKSTNSQLHIGPGYSFSPISLAPSLTNQVVKPSTNYPGFYGRTLANNASHPCKTFHSQVIGSNKALLRDPYNIYLMRASGLDGYWMSSAYYKYFSLTDSVYNVFGNGVALNKDTDAARYPDRFQSTADPMMGWVPTINSAGSSSTGLCDATPILGQLNAAANRAYPALWWGSCNAQYAGGINREYYSNHLDHTTDYQGYSLILLPDIGYTPV